MRKQKRAGHFALRLCGHQERRLEHQGGIQWPDPPLGVLFHEYGRGGGVELWLNPSMNMKTKLILLFTAVATLGSLTSCDAPYGPGYGYGYNNYARPYNSGFGGYGLSSNYYSRPGYAYSGYRSPSYSRPSYSGYRPSYSGYRPGYSGYRSSNVGYRPGFPGNRGWNNGHGHGHRHHNHR